MTHRECLDPRSAVLVHGASTLTYSQAEDGRGAQIHVVPATAPSRDSDLQHYQVTPLSGHTWRSGRRTAHIHMPRTAAPSPLPNGAGSACPASPSSQICPTAARRAQQHSSPDSEAAGPDMHVARFLSGAWNTQIHTHYRSWNPPSPMDL